MANKVKTFRVEGFVKTWCEIKVSADSLENAVVAARSLEVGDFIEHHGEAIDFNLQIIGVRDEVPEVNS